MARIEDMSFRELENRFLLLINPDYRTRLIIKESGCPMRSDNNAMLLYGYVDHEAGLSFQFVCMAYIYDDGRVTFEPRNKEVSAKFRYDSFSGEIVPFDNTEQLIPYMDFEEMIQEGYRCSDDIMKMRATRGIDHLRAPGFPDDIQVIFYKPGKKMEAIWCRIEGINHENETIKGRLLNQPWADYGINIGDIVEFIFYNDENIGLKAFAKLWNDNNEYD